MAENHQRVRVEEIDWAGLLPFLHLFRSFRMAIHPPKLFTALMLVVLLFLSGRMLDAIWGPRVYPGEIQQYATATTNAEFEAWLADRETWVKNQLYRQVRFLTIDIEGGASALVDAPDRFSRAVEAINAHYARQRELVRQRAVETEVDPDRLARRLASITEERRAHLQAVRELQPNGIFDTALRYKVDAFERFIRGATTLNLGFADVLRGQAADRTSVAAAAFDLTFVLPGWLLQTHPWFLAIFFFIAIALWSLLGGALARMAALQATRDDRAGPANAARFAFARWPWFILTPLIPLLVVAVLWLVLYVFGLVFYGIPFVRVVLSLIGSLLFIVALLIGVGMALLLIGYALAFNLLYPAIAVEGTDGFDANSRAFSYVVGRPWHLLFYSFVALIYGAITYLFLGTIVFLALRVTQHAVGSGAGLFIEGTQGGSPFAEMLPAPEFGRLTYGLDTWPTLSPWAKVAALLTMLWSYLLIGLLAAYAVSYYFSAQTWIYLLLRRSADGTDFSDVYVEPIAPLDADNGHAAPPPDKIDPQPPAAPTGPTT